MNDEYETISDVELTIGNLRFIRDAGASEAILDLIKFPAESIGINRNSARQEVRKYVFWDDLDGNPDEFDHLGGHFFTAMWDGDLFEAWVRADLNNKVLMMEVFDEERIISAAIEQGKPEDYAERMVTEPAV